MKKPAICATCKCYVVDPSQKSKAGTVINATQGDCRRLPPTLHAFVDQQGGVKYTSRFPVVVEGWSCWEHKPK